MVGNCPIQDYALAYDPDNLNRIHELWLSRTEKVPVFYEDWQLAYIAYRPDGTVRTLTSCIAAKMHKDGYTVTDIYNLFEVDPKLGLDYVRKLVSEGEEAGAAAARKLRVLGHTSNMIASRLGVSARTVRHWLSHKG